MTQDIERAYSIRLEIIAQKRDIAARFLKLGELFHEVLDKSLWKVSGSDSFNSFCADPEIGFSPKTAYQYADLYKVYVLDGAVDNSRLLNIGPSNLEIIKRKFRDTHDAELLDKAEHLSRGDLLEEMGKPRKNKKFVSSSERDYKEGADAGLDFDAWKMSRGCCTCGEDATERSHMPKTRGAGCGEDDWLPQCSSCHRMFHQVGVDTFLSKYKYPLFSWIHGRLFDAWDRVKP